MLGIYIDVGRHRVVGRPHVDNESLFPQLMEAYVGMVNRRLGGALREKWRSIRWEGWGE
jgi:hypothetical protein